MLTVLPDWVGNMAQSGNTASPVLFHLTKCYTLHLLHRGSEANQILVLLFVFVLPSSLTDSSLPH